MTKHSNKCSNKAEQEIVICGGVTEALLSGTLAHPHLYGFLGTVLVFTAPCPLEVTPNSPQS